MPLQVIGYERADGLGSCVSGVVTKARGIRASFPDLDPSKVPMMAPVAGEKLVYLLEPHAAGRSSQLLRAGSTELRLHSWMLLLHSGAPFRLDSPSPNRLHASYGGRWLKPNFLDTVKGDRLD